MLVPLQLQLFFGPDIVIDPDTSDLDDDVDDIERLILVLNQRCRQGVLRFE